MDNFWNANLLFQINSGLLLIVMLLFFIATKLSQLSDKKRIKKSSKHFVK